MTQNIPIFETPDVTMMQVIDFIDNELSIDSTNLGSEALRSNTIFSHLYKMKHLQDTKLRSLMEVYRVVLHDRWLRYSGKASGEHYKKEPMNTTVLKTDIDKYIQNDSKVITVKTAMDEQDAICKVIEDGIKQASRRQFDIKNALDWKRLVNS